MEAGALPKCMAPELNEPRLWRPTVPRGSRLIRAMRKPREVTDQRHSSRGRNLLLHIMRAKWRRLLADRLTGNGPNQTSYAARRSPTRPSVKLDARSPWTPGQTRHLRSDPARYVSTFGSPFDVRPSC